MAESRADPRFQIRDFTQVTDDLYFQPHVRQHAEEGFFEIGRNYHSGKRNHRNAVIGNHTYVYGNLFADIYIKRKTVYEPFHTRRHLYHAQVRYYQSLLCLFADRLSEFGKKGFQSYGQDLHQRVGRIECRQRKFFGKLACIRPAFRQLPFANSYIRVQIVRRYCGVDGAFGQSGKVGQRFGREDLPQVYGDHCDQIQTRLVVFKESFFY